jgi:hypothetical protein
VTLSSVFGTNDSVILAYGKESGFCEKVYNQEDHHIRYNLGGYFISFISHAGINARFTF